MRRIWVPLLLAGLFLTACGASADDDQVYGGEPNAGVDTRQAMVNLVYSDLLASGEDDPNAMHLSDDEAECVAT